MPEAIYAGLQRIENPLTNRSMTRRSKPLTIWLGILVLLSVFLLPYPADARTPPRLQRLQIAHLIAEMFERFFFSAWLGEPLSLNESGACSQPQLRAALRDKSQFPASFKRSVRDPETPSEYCGAVAIMLKDREVLHFSLTAPKVSDCADYLTKWEQFQAASSIAAAVEPYRLQDQSYDKFGIPVSARSFYQYEPGAKRQKIERVTLEKIRRVQLQTTSEQAGFCQLEFYFISPN